MKKHIPNILTSLNLFAGAVGCIFILSGGAPTSAIYFIAVCAGFDFLDGFAARLLKVQSPIGKELDSLADMVSFGLFPALLMFILLTQSSPIHELAPYAGLLIAVFSGYRLAKFNIDDRQSDQFIGLPTPANAIMIVSIPYLSDGLLPGFIGLILLTIAFSYLLISPIKMVALKFKGAAWKPNVFRYLVIIICVTILVVFQSEGLPYIIPTYLLISILGNLTAKNDV